MILIVEDSKDILDLMRELLEIEGYEVASASNGKEALDFLRSTPKLPEFIFLDLMMPIMDGYVFRAEQMKDTRLSQIPVVLMTANGHIQENMEALKANDCLIKPLNIEDILDRAAKFSK